MDIAQIMASLYASEINCGIQSFWDGGWTAWLGDDMNGRQERTFEGIGSAESPDPWPIYRAVTWIALAAVETYPDSQFAKVYGDAARISAHAEGLEWADNAH